MPDSGEDNVVCRICMDPKDEYVSLFVNDLSNKIMELANVQVEKSDGLPENICTLCEQDLKKCYEFRLRVQTSDKKFRQNLTFSQVDIEECRIKEENYIHDDDSDNRNDTNSICMDDEIDNESDVSPTVNEDEEQGNPSTMNQVDTQADGEENPLTKVEEISVEPYICMKQEDSEAENMDVDCVEPDDPLGPSSSVRYAESQNSIPYLMTSSCEADYTVYSATVPNKSPSRMIESYQCPMPVKTEIHLPVESASDMNTDKSLNAEKSVNVSSNYLLIPHQLGLDAGLLIPFAQQDAKEIPNVQSDSPDIKNKSTCNSSNNDQILSDPNALKSVRSSSSLPQASSAEMEVENKDECFCTICNIDFGFPDLLDEHKNAKNLICRVCTAIFHDHTELESHFAKHRKFICKVCKMVFHVKSDLLQHKSTVETCKNPEVLKCKYCHNKFVHESNFRSHMELKHPNPESRPFACNICGGNFKIHKSFLHHLVSCHLVYENMECDICHKILPGPISLKTHVKTHIQSVSESEVCSICNKILSSKKAVRLHMESHIGEEKVCYICGAIIKGKRTFKHHINYHEKQRKNCSFCNIVFETKLEKDRHYREKHQTSKPAVCEICGKNFKAKEILRTHMMTHSDEKPFVCSICGAAFKSKTVLKTHSRVHSDQRKYTCSQCGESFRWKQTYDKHTVKCGPSMSGTGVGIN